MSERSPSMARTARQSDDSLIELFLDMLAAERGAGENTLAAYRRDLTDFSDYLPRTRRALAGATTDDIRGYLQSLSKRSFAATSVARRLSAIRQFFRFLYAEGHRGDDPAAIIEGPKRGRSLPKLLAVKEVLRQVYGAEPLVTRTGGTVPATALFQTELGAATVTMGWMLPDCRAHAPNEWYRLADYHRGARAYGLLLERLGGGAS